MQNYEYINFIALIYCIIRYHDRIIVQLYRIATTTIISDLLRRSWCTVTLRHIVANIYDAMADSVFLQPPPFLSSLVLPRA